MAGAYQSRKGKRDIVEEAVCDDDLCVWHVFLGAPGSLNEINVMQQSPLYLDVTGGRWPLRNTPLTINGHACTLPFYLIDKVYPRYALLMSRHPMPSTEEQTTFHRLQKAIRKDVERLLGVLTKRFHVALHPGRYRSVSQLVTNYRAICILHDMCVVSRRTNVLKRRRRAVGGDGATNCGVGGHAGGGSDGGEGQSVGTPSGGIAAAGALAPGGGGPGGVGCDIAATGAPAPGGGVGGVAAAIDNIDAVGNAPPALNPIAHPPADGMAAIFDSWAETQKVQENEPLRAALTADIYRDRGELLAPYIE